MSDLDLLQGSWSVTAIESDGQKMDSAMLSGASIVIKGARFQSLGMGADYAGRLTLDDAASPKAFDLKFTSGPEKGNTNRGIYQLAGDDWKICLNTRGGERPKKFAAPKGSGDVLESLKRSQPAGKSARKPSAARKQASAQANPRAATKLATELEGEWQLVSGSLNGKAMGAVEIQWSRRKFEGNTTTYFTGPQVLMRATFTLKNGEIDSEHVAGLYAGKTQLGIYELTGGRLKLSASIPGAPRPRDFTPGAGRNITVWKRV